MNQNHLLNNAYIKHSSLDNTQHNIGITCNTQLQVIIKKALNMLQKLYLIKDMIHKTAVLQVFVEKILMLIYWLQLLWNLVNVSCKRTVNFQHDIDYSLPKHQVNRILKHANICIILKCIITHQTELKFIINMKIMAIFISVTLQNHDVLVGTAVWKVYLT